MEFCEALHAILTEIAEDTSTPPPPLHTPSLAHATAQHPDQVASILATPSLAPAIDMVGMDLLPGLLAGLASLDIPSTDHTHAQEAVTTVLAILSPREALLVLLEQLEGTPFSPPTATAALSFLPQTLAQLPARSRKPTLASTGDALLALILNHGSSLPRSARSSLFDLAQIDDLGHRTAFLAALLPWLGAFDPLPETCLPLENPLEGLDMAVSLSQDLDRTDIPADTLSSPFHGFLCLLSTPTPSPLAHDQIQAALTDALALLSHTHIHVRAKGAHLLMVLGSSQYLACTGEEDGMPLPSFFILVQALVDHMVQAEDERYRDAAFAWFSANILAPLPQDLPPRAARATLEFLLARCPYSQISGLAATGLKTAMALGFSADDDGVDAAFGSRQAWRDWLTESLVPLVQAQMAIPSDPHVLIRRADVYLGLVSLLRLAYLKAHRFSNDAARPIADLAPDFVSALSSSLPQALETSTLHQQELKSGGEEAMAATLHSTLLLLDHALQALSELVGAM